MKRNNITEAKGRYQDLSDQKFVKLTVVELEKKHSKYYYWYCYCDCGLGNFILVSSRHLKSLAVQSCGCFKICAKCGKGKPGTDFNKDLSRKDNLSDECSECEREISKNYRENNSDKIKEWRKKWYWENVETERKRIKKWVQE